ncbi:protein of unknown function [Bradyrhizobium vignae]|uniref:Uncharacterized protein n=1 Tax=Bradyrhizobium vignae TaxID=1549949 RepID=A0A2U3PVQ2_9BRAD|nr:protein of unknown function [Bradyrhizobium vignae]
MMLIHSSVALNGNMQVSWGRAALGTFAVRLPCFEVNILQPDRFSRESARFFSRPAPGQ